MITAFTCHHDRKPLEACRLKTLSGTLAEEPAAIFHFGNIHTLQRP